MPIHIGFIKTGLGIFRSHRGAFEAIEPLFMEGVYEVAHGLGGDAKHLADLLGPLFLVGHSQDLRPTHDEAIVGAEGQVKGCVFVFGERANKEGCFHEGKQEGSVESPFKLRHCKVDPLKLH